MQGAVTTAMVVSLFLTVGLNTMIKANMSKGMSNFVFVAYSNLLAFCFLALAAISVTGALIVTLYKGVPITSGVVSNDVFPTSQQSKWLLGGFLLATSTFCGSVSLVMQF
ncbi:hypothetical protein VNO78_09039 [Psophocarpus tetragonolobus]|uniref:Uncharacterized protein n=1 Tax=Psophocarpus tetragonolobus TaxID=3891 RepID=A0AAN9XTD7_PSOTE